MATAEVGDDEYGEDPTVNRLEAMGAALMGKEAALFVNSGTMGNLVAILTHCQRGDELIAGIASHTFTSESGGAAVLGGVHPHPIHVESDGTLALENIRAAIRSHKINHPHTRLIILENTHNRRGGIPLPLEYMQSVRELADEHRLRIHVDGARIWNAAVALDCKPSELIEAAESVSFCLSKGLCAPAGSLLCGTREFISRARRVRQLLGGGMRQVGVLAAAGLVALEKMTRRLADDHAHARRLAEGLMSVPGINIDLQQVQTNIILFWLADWVPIDAKTIAAELDMKYNVRVQALTARSFRAVTHYWITPEGVDQAITAFAEVLEKATQ